MDNVQEIVEAVTKAVINRLKTEDGIDCASGITQKATCTTVCVNDPRSCDTCGHCLDGRESECRELISIGAARIASAPNPPRVPSDIAPYIDHTLLKPDAKPEEIIKLCNEARQYKFASVCINPSYVSLSKRELVGSGVKVCTVVGFPLGATSTDAKVCETQNAVRDGADEIDMVINVGLLKGGELHAVEEDIRQIKRACQGRVLKVIIETALLSDEEKVTACILSKAAGADFVKTSTGFAQKGATAQDVALMRKTVGPYMGVKAAGGIRDTETAKAMIEAGATRIGASASVAIVKDSPKEAPKGY